MIHQRPKGAPTDLQALVERISDISGSVLVTGRVKPLGHFSALLLPLPLRNSANQAGGLQLEPHLVNVIVCTGTHPHQFNYENALAGNNMKHRQNSEVVLDRACLQLVSMDPVGKTGLRKLPAQNTLLDPLCSVGGMREGTANAEGAFVLRMGKLSRSIQHYYFNMRTPAAIFYVRQIAMKPDNPIL